MTPEQEFIKMLLDSGVTAWHNAGYKGQGVKVLSCQDESTTHGAGIAKIFKRAAPSAEFTSGAHLLSFSGGNITENSIAVNGVKYDFEQYVVDNGFDLVFSSASAHAPTYNNADWIASCARMHNATGVIFNNSAGNVGENQSGEPLAHRFPKEYTILWGSMGYADSGAIKRLNSCLTGIDIDFMAFAPLIGGTSAACPFGTGIEAVVMSKYGKMSLEEMQRYLSSISVDYGAAGADIYYGKGMPKLGNPATQIILQVGSTTMKVNGVNVTIPQAPIIAASGKTLIPVREVVEALGADVAWNARTKTITING